MPTIWCQKDELYTRQSGYFVSGCTTESATFTQKQFCNVKLNNATDPTILLILIYVKEVLCILAFITLVQ